MLMISLSAVAILGHSHGVEKPLELTSLSGYYLALYRSSL